MDNMGSYGMGNYRYGNPGLGEALGLRAFQKLRQYLSGGGSQSAPVAKPGQPMGNGPVSLPVGSTPPRPVRGLQADWSDRPWWQRPSSYEHPTATRNIPVDYEHTVTTVAPEGNKVIYKTAASPQPPPPEPPDNPYSSLGMPRGNEGAISGPPVASGSDYGNKVPGYAANLTPLTDTSFAGLMSGLAPPPQPSPPVMSQPQYTGPVSSGPGPANSGGGGGIMSLLPLLASMFMFA